MPLCETCATIDLREPKEPKEKKTRTNSDEGEEDDDGDDASSIEVPPNIRLGLWRDLVSRAEAQPGCGGCRFFVDMLTTHVRDRGSSDVPQFFADQNAYMARRYRDSTPEENPDFSKDEVWISSWRVAYRTAQDLQKQAWRYSCDDLVMEICCAEKGERKNGSGTEFDYYREIPRRPGEEGGFELMRKWLKECDGHRCELQEERQLPKRVIEITGTSASGYRVLETNGQKGRYAVLSHRWGDVEFPKLTSQSLPKYLKQIPDKDLALNFKDALAVCRELSITHLWIDALCILQDHPDEIASELARTADYFSHSTLVLAADNAESAQASLLQDRRILCSPIMGIGNYKRLRPACLRWREAVDSSPLSKKAFDLQGRMLAPRLLHFTQRQMIWECNRGWQLEAANALDPKVGAGMISYKKELVQPLFSPSSRIPPGAALSATEHAAERYGAWVRCLNDLSGAKVPPGCADKLAAVAGLATAFDDGSLGAYLAGIWERTLPFALAWGRTYQLLTRAKPYRAPSWSWASVDGDVSMDIPKNAAALLEGPSEWMKQRGPRIVETRINRDEAAPVYTGFAPGSCLELEGWVLSVRDVARVGDVFHPTLVADTSNLFDCACCRPQEGVEDTSGQSAERFMGHICLVVRGGAWNDAQNQVWCIVLQAVDGGEEAGNGDGGGEEGGKEVGGNGTGVYERVGVCLFDFEFSAARERLDPEYAGKSAEDEFWDMGWEKRMVKLI